MFVSPCSKVSRAFNSMRRDVNRPRDVTRGPDVTCTARRWAGGGGVR